MDERQHPQPELRPVIGVALVLGLVALMLGAGLLVRQARTHPSTQVALATPGQHLAMDAPGSKTSPVPTSTVVLAVAVPAATGTPTAATIGPLRTPVAQQVALTPTMELDDPRDSTPRPLVVGTLQAPPQPAETVAPPPSSAGATPATADTEPASADGGNQASASGGTYTGLPVAVPTTAVLDGAELPVGPAGVRSDGARAFARTLLDRARAQDSGPVEDPVLRQAAEQALADELAATTPSGRVVPTRLRQGSVTVQIDIVATLPETAGASLPMFSTASVPAIGVAVGVAGRIEPDYLPDLVAVAAMAYR
jgi:hypothetical protein